MDDLRKLDLNLLVVFEAVYSAGNISHAAKLLGLTQPTISNALSRLREGLDDQLFTRAGRGVEPTPRAMQMIGPVREALQMIKGGVSPNDDFDPKTTKRNFRMVLLDQLEPVLMPPLIRKIQDYQSITLETLHVATTPVKEGLSDGSLDIVLSTFVSGVDEIECEEIGTASIVMVARKDHPKINGEISMKQFQTLGQIALIPKLRAMSSLDEVLRHHGIERHIVYTVNKFWSFPHIIASTDLIAMMPGDFAKCAAQYYPLEIYPAPFDLPRQQIYMTWKKGRNNDTGHRWLRKQIIKAYEN